jgi:hypothetical protein
MSAPTIEEKFARFFIGGCDVIVACLSGLFGHLELDWLARLLLAHGCAIDCVTMRRDVLDPQSDDVASLDPAIDG